MNWVTCETCGSVIDFRHTQTHVAWHGRLLNDLERARNHRHVTPNITPSDAPFINRTGNAEPIPDSWAREMPEVAR